MPVYGTAFLGQMVQGIPDTTPSSNQVEKCSAQPAPWRHSDPERGPHLCLSMAYGQGAPDIPWTRRISQGCKCEDCYIHPKATCYQALPSPHRSHSSRHTPGGVFPGEYVQSRSCTKPSRCCRTACHSAGSSITINSYVFCSLNFSHSFYLAHQCPHINNLIHITIYVHSPCLPVVLQPIPALHLILSRSF